MDASDIIKAAIPDADEKLCNFILWNRTPFPFALNPRQLYKSASGYFRAESNGRTLCDFCSNEAESGDYTCIACNNALKGNISR